MPKKATTDHGEIIHFAGRLHLFPVALRTDPLEVRLASREDVKLEKELQRLVIGSSGRAYSIGDELKVKVEAADPARRRITLALADKAAPKSERWLTPDDLAATSRSKPRRPGPRAPAQAPHRPPRGSPPARPPRRKERRGGGR